MFLRRSLAHMSYMYMIFFPGTFGGLAPPPPNTKKLATLVVDLFDFGTKIFISCSPIIEHNYVIDQINSNSCL